MNFLRNNLANFFTLGNLFSGSIGAIQLIRGDYQTTAICILVSLILDFFDGFVARAMKSDSNLGAQLDSLADMVSFGLIPGLAVYLALEPYGNEILGIYLPFELKYFGLLITLFSALRLAIFNLDEDQKYYFKGLNTPSNTILIFGIYAFFQKGMEFFPSLFGDLKLMFTLGPIFWTIIAFLNSWLLVSPIKMIAMKFKSKKLSDNMPKLVLLIGSILILLLLGQFGIPLVIVYYILISLIFQKQLK